MIESAGAELIKVPVVKSAIILGENLCRLMAEGALHESESLGGFGSSTCKPKRQRGVLSRRPGMSLSLSPHTVLLIMRSRSS